MKRNILFFCALTLSALLLTGCGGGNVATGNNNSGQQEAAPEVIYEGERYTDEEKVLHTLMGSSFEEYYYISAAGWPQRFDDAAKLEAATELLQIFADLGNDVSAYNSETFLEALTNACTDNTDSSVFETAAEVLNIDIQPYIEIYDNYNMYCMLEEHSFGGYRDAKKDNWFGTTSDEQRLSAASVMLDTYIELGYTFDITPQQLVDSINSFYNEGNDDVKVMDAAIRFLPEEIDYEGICLVWDLYSIMNLDFDITNSD